MLRKIGHSSDFGRITAFASFKTLKGQAAYPADNQIYKMQYLQNRVSCWVDEFLKHRLASDFHVAFKQSAAYFHIPELCTKQT
jgi:hypothetical protein